MAVPRIVMNHKLAAYGLASLGVASSVVVRAFSRYPNFYSASVYLARSAASVLALANMGFFFALLFGRLMQRIFFGPLRPSEVERLYDRIWYFLTESLLAFTIFRDEFDTPFIIMFGVLLFLKSFHWILGDRLEWMDQVPYPGPPTSFHVRTTILFLVLWTCDFLMLSYAIDAVMENGVGGIVLFGNEYAILLAILINYMLRYLIVMYDIRRARTRGGEQAPPWEDKSMYLFYTELLTDFFKLITYMVFFILVMTFYGVPLNIIRDVYITARSFVTRTRDLIRYRNATKNMDQRYPNATVEEMAAMDDRTCIICREEMVAADPAVPRPADGPNMTPKKLPCGHMFHFQCLRSWLERQQSCPTCRRTVLDAPTAAARPAGQQPGVPGQPNAANAGAPRVLLQFGDPNLLAGLGFGGLGAGWANALGQNAQNGVQQPQGAAPVAQPGGVPLPNGPAPTGVQGQPAPTQTQGGPSTGPLPQSTAPPDPRAAAAQAALRRFGSARGEAGPSPAPSQPPSLSSVPDGRTGGDLSHTHTHAHLPTHHTHQTPTLIPLFAPNLAARLPTANFSSSQFSSSQFQSVAGPSAPEPPSSSALDLFSRSAPLTREVIDERLGDLERLQGTLWNYVEELTKLRSKLPEEGEAGPSTPRQRERELPMPSDAKGKGVQQDGQGSGEH